MMPSAAVHRYDTPAGVSVLAPLSPPAPAPVRRRQAPDLSFAPGLSPPCPRVWSGARPTSPLHRLYTQALHGQRHVVFVTGEAGIGKTALVETFVQGLSHDPGLWIGHGQCIEQYGAGEAYLPLLEALDRLCRGPGASASRGAAGPICAELGRTVAGLLSAGTWPTCNTLVGTTRERMLRELSVALDVVSAVHPLVLVLEDLH